MKLDVLDGFDQVGVVVGYRDGEGGLVKRLPACASDWDHLRPEVRMLKGWSRPTRGLQRLEDLAPEARAYMDVLSECCSTPIAYLSTGPDRAEGFTLPGSCLEGRL